MRVKYVLVSLVLALVLLLTLGLAGDLRIESAAAEAAPVTASQTASFYLYHHTFLKNYYGHTSALYLQNPNAESATVALLFRDLSSGEEYPPIYETISAGSTLEMTTESLPQLPDGSRYSVVVSADSSVESVVRICRSVASGDELASYRGVSSGSTLLHLGPFHKNWAMGSDSLNSGITLWNIGGSTAAVSVDFLNADGSAAGTVSAGVGPGEQWPLYAADQDGLPDGFRGWVRVTADEPIIGWLHQGSASNEVFQAYGPLEDSAVGGTLMYRSSLPRVLKEVDEGNGLRTTQLFVGNTASTEAQAQLDYYAAGGTLIWTRPLSVPAGGATVIDLGEEGALPGGGIWALVLSADQPVLLGEVYYNEGAYVSVGTYGSETADRLNLPRLAHTDRGHTVFSVQNLGSAADDVTVRYRDLTGAAVFTQTTTLPAGGWVRYDQSQMPQLGGDFEGSAVIESTTPLRAEVDEYSYEPCEPVSNVEVARTPTGDLFTGNTVLFTASAVGTRPFSYTWTLDGAPVGADQSTFERTLTLAGTYTVGVNVTNGCGQGGDTTVVDVQEPAKGQPDLSQSYESASLTNVTPGDRLTYTLLLRNTSSVTASAVLTDLIPAHTTYVADSAKASDGNPVTVSGDALHWAGQIISGTPVVIESAVEVLSPPVGTVITKATRLNDGLGNVIQLGTDVAHNPGYRLTVNKVALGTDVPTVTVSLSWPTEGPAIEKMKISNDGGFGSGTGWIDVSGTYSDWALTTEGDPRTPRTVYALFQDEEGKQYGPIHDDIVYDPDPPKLTRIEVFTQTSQGGDATGVRVTVSDSNSGVAKAQISQSQGFETYSEFPVTGRTTDIPWPLEPSDDVYVRVLDRAGNVSEVKSRRGLPTSKIYLPLVLRY